MSSTTSTMKVAGLALAFSSIFTTTSAAPRFGRRQTSCGAAWDSTTAYTQGSVVSENGVNYVANWWTQGNDPSTNSGASGSGEPWTSQGSCSGGGSGPAPTSSSPPPPSTSTQPATPPPSGNPSSSVFWSPYKDVTINANWNTGEISTDVTGTAQKVVDATPNLPVLTWAFATGECGSENWGGISPSDMAINAGEFNSAGIKYVLSTGGAGGVFTCGSDSGFDTFISTYASDSLVGVDFDIEAGQTQDDINDLVARVGTALSNPSYSNLRFSFTVATFGGDANPSLGSMGITVMSAIQSANLLTTYPNNVFINLMAMDYGSATAGNCVVVNGECEMGQSAVQAAQSLNSQYGVPFGNIELTPMIGGNDSADETFTLDDLTTVANFALQNGLGGIHYWSYDRDTPCPAGSSSATCNTYPSAGTLAYFNGFLSAL